MKQNVYDNAVKTIFQQIRCYLSSQIKEYTNRMFLDFLFFMN